LRTPVGALLEHALSSALASASDKTSGGRRRDVPELVLFDVDEDRGLVALT